MTVLATIITLTSDSQGIGLWKAIVVRQKTWILDDADVILSFIHALLDRFKFDLTWV